MEEKHQYLLQPIKSDGNRSKWPEKELNFDNSGSQLTTPFNRPLRIEGQVHDLEIYGEVPKSISGTFYRIQSEPYYVPYVKNEIWINGHGVVSSFRIQDGHVDFNQRFVQSEVLLAEKKERRALMGKYRNKYSDLAVFEERTTSNVTVYPYRDKILALKEDGRPHILNPDTLETIGIYDFEGQLDSKTFTAHPKWDPVTKEFLCFGYEAKGLGTLDNCYMSIKADGIMTEKVWFKAPWCGFQHEFSFTKNYVLFPLIPMECFVDKMKEGGNKWTWTDRPYMIGILPRYGANGNDIKWFKGVNGYCAHVANAFEENGKIHLQMSYTPANAFGFFPDARGNAPDPHSNAFRMCEWVIDPAADNLQVDPPRVLFDMLAEFPRIDERVQGSRNRYMYGNAMEFSQGPEATDWQKLGPMLGAYVPSFNNLFKLDTESGKVELYRNGRYSLYQEPVFIPREPGSPEGDGYLMAAVNNYEDMSSEVVIIDCQNFTEHVALIKLPLQLRFGVHGAWVDDADINGHAVTLAGTIRNGVNGTTGNNGAERTNGA